MVTGKSALLRAQRRWADTHSVGYDAYGCVRDLGDNLHAPLDDAAYAEFLRGSELTPGTDGPRRVTEGELRATFSGDWRVQKVIAESFSVANTWSGPEPSAWLARIIRR